MFSKLARPAFTTLRPVSVRHFSSSFGASDAWQTFGDLMSGVSSVTVPDRERKERMSGLSRTGALAALLPVSMVSSTVLATTPIAAAAAASTPLLHQFLAVFPPLCFGFLQLSGCVCLRSDPLSLQSIIINI